MFWDVSDKMITRDTRMTMEQLLFAISTIGKSYLVYKTSAFYAICYEKQIRSIEMKYRIVDRKIPCMQKCDV